jgi:hypothetical protein
MFRECRQSIQQKFHPDTWIVTAVAVMCALQCKIRHLLPDAQRAQMMRATNSAHAKCSQTVPVSGQKTKRSHNVYRIRAEIDVLSASHQILKRYTQRIQNIFTLSGIIFSYRLWTRNNLMESHSSFPTRNLQVPEILFVVSVCFAMGAVGFFGAVYLQLRNTNDTSTIASVGPLTVDQKAHIAQSLAAQTTGTSTTTTGGTTEATAIVPTSQQADQGDKNAAEKLRIMQALSAH